MQPNRVIEPGLYGYETSPGLFLHVKDGEHVATQTDQFTLPQPSAEERAVQLEEGIETLKAAGVLHRLSEKEQQAKLRKQIKKLHSAVVELSRLSNAANAIAKNDIKALGENEGGNALLGAIMGMNKKIEQAHNLCDVVEYYATPRDEMVLI